MERVGGMNPDGGGVLSVWPSPREFGGPTICTSDALLMLHVASMCASVQGCICHKPLQLSPRRPHAEQRLLIPDAVRDCRLQMQAADARCMYAYDCVSVMSIHYVRQPNRKPVPDVHRMATNEAQRRQNPTGKRANAAGFAGGFGGDGGCILEQRKQPDSL